MKHAYLIMAHNEPEILKTLIESIDDERNDIFVHIDRKAAFDGQDMKTKKAGLQILKQRIDARWGDISLVHIEYLLFETAHRKGIYTYYHLISGVDLPIKSQDYIHEFCQQNFGKEFIGFVPDKYARKELRNKVGVYHLFPRHFRTNSIIIKLLRNITKSIQLLLGIRRNKNVIFKKGCQWCSITNNLVEYLISNKSSILPLYTYTFCPDEIFIPTACWNSPYKGNVYNIYNGYVSCKRYIHWENNELRPIDDDDLSIIMSSDSWFARKFSIANSCTIKKILRTINMNS